MVVVGAAGSPSSRGLWCPDKHLRLWWSSRRVPLLCLFPFHLSGLYLCPSLENHQSCEVQGVRSSIDWCSVRTSRMRGVHT